MSSGNEHLVPPEDAGEIEGWVNSLSIKQLKSFIASQGLKYADCVEREELRARAKQAVENFRASERVDRVHVDESVKHAVCGSI